LKKILDQLRRTPLNPADPIRRDNLKKSQNIRNTLQRRVILEELRKLYTHPSADELYEIARKNLPHISLGTVYRNLEILSAMGEIQKLEYGGLVKRFDGNHSDHYHIRCIRCDKIVDAPLGATKTIENKLKKQTDFKILGHRIEFFGICPECLCRESEQIV
jgi:Fe2+ or Zn2+ uptake regulation protein